VLLLLLVNEDEEEDAGGGIGDGPVADSNDWALDSNAVTLLSSSLPALLLAAAVLVTTI